MPRVSKNSQVVAQSVVARARGRVLAIALPLVGAWCAPAAAAPRVWPRPVAARVSEPPSPPAAPDHRASAPGRSYALPLGLSYGLAPFLALAVGGGLSELEVDDTLAVVGGGLMFALPAVVHMAHGQFGHGAAVFPEMLALTGIAVFAGGGIGYAIDAASCPGDGDECDFAGLEGLVGGALLGGVAAYTGFAIYDVSCHGEVPAEVAPAQTSLRLWVGPLPRSALARAEGSSLWSGVQLGVTLER